MKKIPEEFNDFYKLIDPAARQSALDKIEETPENKELLYAARKYFALRHTDGKKVNMEIDKFIFICVMLISLYKGGVLFKKGNQKEIRKLFKDAGLYEERNPGEEIALYMEYRNGAARYFDTCKTSGYKRKLFGAMDSSADEKTAYMIQDAWKMSYGISKKYDLIEELSLWNEAVKEEIALAYDGALQDFLELETKEVK